MKFVSPFPVQIYRFFTSIRLAVMVLVFLAVDLCFAYISLNGRQSLFEPMNRLAIPNWLITYGVENIRYTAWFFVLLLLLCILAVNMLACAGDRLPKLARRWRTAGGSRRNWFSLSTHIMHLSVALVLFGYLISYSMARVHPGLTITPDLPTKIPGAGISLELLEMKLPVYEGSRLKSFSGRVIRPAILLRMRNQKKCRTAWLGFNRPVRFQGYAIFLQNFSPKSKTAMSRSRYIVVEARQDPGVWLYFTGIVFFLAGMLGVILFRARQGKFP